MKLKRLLKRLRGILDSDERERRGARKSLEKVLAKLKTKQRKLAAEAANTRDTKDQAALEAKRKVVRAQRRKGIAALKAMKKSAQR